jgi:hypothetical protein
VRRLGLVLFFGFITGCASSVIVDPGTVHIGERMSVRADDGWNRIDGDSSADATQVWTAEGVTLDMLLFYDGNLPGWRPGMLPHDVVELYESLVARDGGAFRLERLAPARFGEAPGFFFEHTTTTRSGLELRGRAYGALVEEKLYLMSYTAPASHFYAKHLPRVEALAASARFRPRGNAAFASP